MTEDESPPDEEELEEKYSDDDAEESESPYTVQLNGKKYALNKEARRAIQNRAQREYKENEMFTCFWKVAHPEQYAEGAWDEAIHEQGDPVLVIETHGPKVPWEKLDTLNVEMQEVGPDSQLDREMDQQNDSKPAERDNGNGVKTIDPGDVKDDDDVEKEVGRTHFSLTPQQFEEVPDPDGEEADKIPAKPEQMGDDPALITWIPEYPSQEHLWGAGQAICAMYNRIEWNVQVKADQPTIDGEKASSHDHWESMLKSHDCEVVGKLGPSQRPNKSDEPSGQVERKGKDQFEDGKYGGNNWQV